MNSGPASCEGDHRWVGPVWMLIHRQHDGRIPACPLPHGPQHSQLHQLHSGEPLLEQPRVSWTKLSHSLCRQRPFSHRFPCQVCTPCPPLCLQHSLHGQQPPVPGAGVGTGRALSPWPWQQRLGRLWTSLSSAGPLVLPLPSQTHLSLLHRATPALGCEVKGVGLGMGDREGSAVAMPVWGVV